MRSWLECIFLLSLPFHKKQINFYLMFAYKLSWLHLVWCMLIQISYVQVQRRSSHTLGSLFHDHLFSILFIFTGIYLVNYILLSSAADESSETVVMNFQDATELMHQVCISSFCLFAKSCYLLLSLPRKRTTVSACCISLMVTCLDLQLP